MKITIGEILSIVIVVIGMLWFGSLGKIPQADIAAELQDRYEGKQQAYSDYMEWKAERETTSAPVVEETPVLQLPPPVMSESTGQFSEWDKYLLAKIAMAEAGNQGTYGMALVMNVVINRANKCNASIEAIITSPGQFDGFTNQALWGREPSAEAWQAIELVMNGWNESQGALYFCTPQASGYHDSKFTYLFTYGNSRFYR